MNRTIRALLLANAIFVSVLAEVPIAAPRIDPASPPAPVERRAEFRCVAALLEAIVDDAGSRGSQRLYIGPLEREDTAAFVRVYWPQAHAILLIDWPTSCSDEDMRIDDAVLGWYRTKARIDLDTDVVPTADDIGGSSYLVDKPWVDAVVADCLKRAPLVIEPSVPKRVPSN